MGASAHRLNAIDDGPDLLRRRPLFHYDHHVFLKPLKDLYVAGAKVAYIQAEGVGARRDLRSTARAAVAGRLAKSPIRGSTPTSARGGGYRIGRRGGAVHPHDL